RKLQRASRLGAAPVVGLDVDRLAVSSLADPRHGCVSPDRSGSPREDPSARHLPRNRSSARTVPPPIVATHHGTVRSAVTTGPAAEMWRIANPIRLSTTV